MTLENPIIIRLNRIILFIHRAFFFCSLDRSIQALPTMALRFFTAAVAARVANAINRITECKVFHNLICSLTNPLPHLEPPSPLMHLPAARVRCLVNGELRSTAFRCLFTFVQHCQLKLKVVYTNYNSIS